MLIPCQSVSIPSKPSWKLPDAGQEWWVIDIFREKHRFILSNRGYLDLLSNHKYLLPKAQGHKWTRIPITYGTGAQVDTKLSVLMVFWQDFMMFLATDSSDFIDLQPSVISVRSPKDCRPSSVLLSCPSLHFIKHRGYYTIYLTKVKGKGPFFWKKWGFFTAAP